MIFNKWYIVMESKEVKKGASLSIGKHFGDEVAFPFHEFPIQVRLKGQNHSYSSKCESISILILEKPSLVF
jgi:hypothetical protein